MSIHSRVPGTCIRVSVAILTLGFGLVLSSPSFAQNENETIGFSSTHVFDGGYFRESVDVSNGNLSLPIPISPSSELNRDLRWCTFRASTLLFAWS